MIGREELRQALEAWLPSSRRRRSSLPVEAVKVWPDRQAARPTAGQSGPDPWARAQQELDRQLAAFDGIEKRMAQAAIRDGLTEDGPLVPTLQALSLCIDSLREMTRISSQIPNHYVGQILDALATSRTVAEAETDRFRAEIEHTEADIVHRIAHSIAQSADKALTARVQLLTWATFFAFVFLFASAIACAYALGDWRGSARAYDDIHETEQGLSDAFAKGKVSADLWWTLMRSNNITLAIDACREPENRILTANGHTACRVPLWLEPPIDPPLQLQIVQPMPQRDTHPAPAPQPEDRPIKLFGILPTPPHGPVHFGP